MIRATPACRTMIAAFLLLAATFAHGAGFDLTDTDGRRHRLADLSGRWVVVNFWATWCVPCIEEMPGIAAFARAHPDVVVIGIATDSGDRAKVMRFAAQLGIPYPLVLSDASVEKQLGHPHALPTTRIYDPAGRVVYDRPGRVDRRSLEAITKGAAKDMESA
ncbi:MAG TPA: TlpA disulfide reductase family protein [Usitatibacter sp.]|nr:TlpA disulfide reductase family protein [Usitatibacter sp.]